MRNVNTHERRSIWMLVDTGASMSTLSARSAGKLGISCQLEKRDIPVTFRGIAGVSVVGLPRYVNVFLGGVLRTIPIAVEPDQKAMRLLQRRGLKASPLKGDLLGRADILEQYLLCFDAERLYAFPTL
jgi:hypothetical protein